LWVVLLWLLLFVAPAQFNAHTRSGLALATLIVLAVPPIAALPVARLIRVFRA